MIKILAHFFFLVCRKQEGIFDFTYKMAESHPT